jgi:hypothetical protein
VVSVRGRRRGAAEVYESCKKARIARMSILVSRGIPLSFIPLEALYGLYSVDDAEIVSVLVACIMHAPTSTRCYCLSWVL